MTRHIAFLRNLLQGRGSTSTLRGLAAGMLTCVTLNTAWAQPVFHEVEPNGTPDVYNRLAGSARIIGSMAEGDQDGFLWSVSDVDAASPWTLTLQGIPGRLTIAEVLRLSYSDDGQSVTGRERLFTLGSRDGVRPSVAENLLFEPGDYVLGLAYAGGNAPFRPPAASISFTQTGAAASENQETEPADSGYRLTLEPGRAYPAQRSTDNASADRAMQLRPGRGFSALTGSESSWFSIVITDSDAGSRWDLTAQVAVGRTAALTLSNSDGTTLASARAGEHGAMRLPDLSLEPGRYLVELQTKAESLYALSLENAGGRVDGEEAEPNDQWSLANRVPGSLGAPLAGRMQRQNDQDYFAFELTEASVEQQLALEVTAGAQQSYRLCLLNARGDNLHCRDGNGSRRFGNLVLLPGHYGLHMSRAPEGMAYQVRLVADAPHEPSMEAEPNDTVASATGVPANNRIKGRTEKDDIDFIRFDLSGPAQLWRFQAMGTAVHEVAYYDGSGQRAQVIRAAPGQNRVTLDNLFLLPGTHYIAVSGRDEGEYTLLARALGAPDPNGELEPNDDATRMQPIRPGQERNGTLPDAQDRDNYRFHLAAHDHIRLEIQPPADGRIRALLDWDGERLAEATSASAGAALTLQGVFPPGDYRVELNATQPSEAEYRLGLSRLPRYACASDCEPNNSSSFANPVPANGLLTGQVGEWRDEDWYALPVFDEEVSLSVSGEGGAIAVVAGWNEPDDLQRAAASGERTAVIPAGAERYLRLRGNGDYQYQLAFAGRPPPLQAAQELELNLELATTQVAAYQFLGQRVAGTVSVHNRGSEAAEISLAAHATDSRWSVELERETFTLAAGEILEAAMQVSVPDDAWADRTVRISLAALGNNQVQAEASIDISVDREVGLVDPEPHWPIPEALRGGLNLAWTALGSTPAPVADQRLVRNIEQLFDGMAVREEGLTAAAEPADARNAIIIELAGQAPAEVAGFALNPFGRAPTLRYARRFEVALSDDGRTFRTVLRDHLQPQAREQYFPLEQPTVARFARLTLLDNYSGRPDVARHLGEWKVIAAPGNSPFSDQSHNIADPALGGHVVRSAPILSQRWDDAILNPGSDATRVRIGAANHLEWVIGFHHNRAALIDSIEWELPEATTGAVPIEALDIAVSLDSPLGPWQSIGRSALAVGQDTMRMELDAPVWARFVRFATDPMPAPATVFAPAVVRVFEQAEDASYRSILGEWGADTDRGIRELLHPLAVPPDFVRAAHDRRSTAAPLEDGDSVAGRVWLGRHEHWYRVELVAGQNTVVLELSGEPTLRTVVSAEDSAGNALELRIVEESPTRQRLEAYAGDEKTLYIKIEEPPRNVVFSWDTSASIGAYLPTIYNALTSYAADLEPGRDAANLMPFGGSLLLRDWHGEPYLMQKVLNEYPREESSSAAEQTLARASSALERRAGAKAVVLVTDAATNRYPAMWDAFDRGHPRIMALALDSHGAFGRAPVREQDLMQDWARVRGGHYAHLQSEGQMEVAFDRAVTLMREPAPYQLGVQMHFRDAPQPGLLTVVSGSGNQAALAGTAIGLVLDASGSMLQRLEGTRRIEIARQGLIDAVTRHLPAGTPVALRVFGHREANACRTDLEIPLGPLDPESVRATIQAVEARNLARTPIADSLAQMERDLASASGTRTVVLVTDGEETCEGDPGAVIQELIDKGFDMRLNIIGFALDDADLEQQFAEWAALGGGDYFSAGDADSFGAALDAALQVPFAVVDGQGTEIARGLVDGDPIAVPAGSYRVLVMSGTARQFENVRIPAGEAVDLSLGQ